MDTESNNNAAAVATQDASTQADFKVTTSIKALKGDAALKMFKIYDSSTKFQIAGIKS